jgi:hypothetical protein
MRLSAVEIDEVAAGRVGKKSDVGPRLRQYYIYSSGKSCAMYPPLTTAWQIPEVELRSKNIRLAQPYCNRVSTYHAWRFKVMGRYCGCGTPEYQVILIAGNRD